MSPKKPREGRGAASEAKLLTRPMSHATTRKSVSIIGAGRLGTALAIALSSRGYLIEAVVTRRLANGRRSASLIGPETRVLSSRQLTQLPPSDIVIIATPDDMIEEAAAGLSSSTKWSGKGRTVLHASGALSSEVLSNLRAIGFNTGSMHPLMSISDPVVGAENLSRAHFCIEGEKEAKRVARSIVAAIGGKSFTIKSRDKALYHAAAVMASGHVVALFALANETLQSCGLSVAESRAALLPLLTSTTGNLNSFAPAHALTGTFARADVEVVRKHLAALVSSGLNEALEAYILLGEHSLRVAKLSGAPKAAVRRIHQLLQAASERRIRFTQRRKG